VQFPDIASHLSEEFGIQMPVNSFRHEIVKVPRFHLIKGTPRNARHDDTLEAVLQYFPMSLVINIHETGPQEWAHVHAEKGVAPEFRGEGTVRIFTGRETKHARLLAAITAEGAHPKPEIMAAPEKLQ
jgi:hypothetical protein